jgi:hypothetical protein
MVSERERKVFFLYSCLKLKTYQAKEKEKYLRKRKKISYLVLMFKAKNMVSEREIKVFFLYSCLKTVQPHMDLFQSSFPNHAFVALEYKITNLSEYGM